MTAESLPHWDLTNVYPGLESEEFKTAVAQAKAQLDDLDEYLAAHQISSEGQVPQEPASAAQKLGGYLDRMNAILRLVFTLRSYIGSFVSTDSYNTLARRLMSQLEPMLVRAERQEVQFGGWIGLVTQTAPSIFQAALALEGPGWEHAFYLTETAEQSRYLMSEAEEALAAELSLSGIRAWTKLQGVVTTQLKVPFEREGQTTELPITVLQTLRTDPDEAVRRRAYEAELAAWESVREPLAACMNGVKGTVATLNRRRGRIDALHAALDKARIDRETLEAMLGAMSRPRQGSSAKRPWRGGTCLRRWASRRNDMPSPKRRTLSWSSLAPSQTAWSAWRGVLSTRTGSTPSHAMASAVVHSACASPPSTSPAFSATLTAPWTRCPPWPTNWATLITTNAR
jgi:oligoendopeptidase F